MIAALFVATGGCYFGLEDVDPWDEARDARKYGGPHAVVAHPPCARWCQLAGLVEKRWGHKRGDDGGCFESALASVRSWGGVLEHPAWSRAWDRFLLPEPPPSGGWVRGICGGWSCHVEQHQYGHPAKKATWLYAFGVAPPPMRWGSASTVAPALVSFCNNHGTQGDTRKRLSKKAALATPAAFQDELINIARSVRHRGKNGERVVEDMSKRQRAATPPNSATCSLKSHAPQEATD